MPCVPHRPPRLAIRGLDRSPRSRRIDDAKRAKCREIHERARRATELLRRQVHKKRKGNDLASALESESGKPLVNGRTHESFRAMTAREDLRRGSIHVLDEIGVPVRMRIADADLLAKLEL